MNTAPALVWLRRELRLHDNAALLAAVETGRPVLPVFVLDDTTPGPWRPGGAARWWLHHSLAALAAALAARGGALLLRRGPVAQVLPALAAETGATEIHAGEPVEPWARAAMDALGAALPVPLRRHRTLTLFDPAGIRTRTGGPYGVYTPFMRACRASGGPPPPRPAPSRIPAPPALPRTDTLADWRLLPTAPDWAGGLRATWTPGEDAARARLATFADRIVQGYDRTRNLPAMDGTAMLSPHLHWGEISPAEAWHAVDGIGGPGVETWQNELIWREFSAHLLLHHPAMPDRPLKPDFERMPWQTDPAALRAWQRGRTGIPIVDAGMRQLWRTGWMHNRVRMIVASFLVKHLLLPWQAGEAWFWDTLVDADLASNSAQWQWVAGSGADAAPFFRVFNPVLQGQKFDPDGAYVRAHVPELVHLPAAHIHAPWDAPELILRAAGLRLGAGYPRPLVDLAAGRDRALAAFRALRSKHD